MADKVRSNLSHVVGRSWLGLAVAVVFWLAGRGQADDGEWRVGRATYYGENHNGNNDGFSIHHGSCQFGKLDPMVGTGWDIAAIPDAHPDFQGSCGKCYELACKGMVFEDNYGEGIDRRNACHSETNTVIVTVVDSCPCKYSKNSYSNRRWCCGDMDHFDISVFAFEKLAPVTNGVIGLKYRPVHCPSYDEFMPSDPNMVVPQMNGNAPATTHTRVSRSSSTDLTSTKMSAGGKPSAKDSGVTIISSDPLRETTRGGNTKEEMPEPEPELKSASKKAKELAAKVLKEDMARDQPNRDKILVQAPVKEKIPLSLVKKPPTVVVTGTIRRSKSKSPKAAKGKESRTSFNSKSKKKFGESGSHPAPPPAGVLTRLSRSSRSDTTSTRGSVFGGPVESRVQAMVVPTIVRSLTPVPGKETAERIIGEVNMNRNRTTGFPKSSSAQKKKEAQRSKPLLPLKSSLPVPRSTKTKAKKASQKAPAGPATAPVVLNATVPSVLPSKAPLKCSASKGPISIFKGGFNDCFVDGGLLRYTPVNSNGFEGRPAWCSVLGPRRSVAAVSLGRGTFAGKKKLGFYLFIRHGCPDIAIYLVGRKGACGPINVKDLKPGSERSGYKNFSLGIELIDFEGCALKSEKDVYAISFKNNLDNDQGVCIEEMKLS